VSETQVKQLARVRHELCSRSAASIRQVAPWAPHRKPLNEPTSAAPSRRCAALFWPLISASFLDRLGSTAGSRARSTYGRRSPNASRWRRPRGRIGEHRFARLPPAATREGGRCGWTTHRLAEMADRHHRQLFACREPVGAPLSIDRGIGSATGVRSTLLGRGWFKGPRDRNRSFSVSRRRQPCFFAVRPAIILRLSSELPPRHSSDAPPPAPATAAADRACDAVDRIRYHQRPASALVLGKCGAAAAPIPGLCPTGHSDPPASGASVCTFISKIIGISRRTLLHKLNSLRELELRGT